MWWTGTRARDDTSPIRHFVGKCSRVRLCLFYPFCSASEIKSTEEFSNESGNWESAEDISENDSQKSADS